MGKFDDLIDMYIDNMKNKIGIARPDKKLLTAIAKGLGPSLYRQDAAKVACGDKDEIARIKKNYLIKKLGLKDSEKLDAGLKEVCKEMGSSNRSKWRPIFYYLCVKKFKKSGFYK